MYEHELPGLHGDNLLAFLAALGTLRVLSRGNADAPDASSATALSWREQGGAWIPVLHHPFIETRAALTEELASRCCLYEPTRRRQILEAAEQRFAAHKEEFKSALATLKGTAKKAAQERADAEQISLQTAVAEARVAWQTVENVFAERRNERDRLKAEARKAVTHVEQAEKEAPPRPKKTDNVTDIAVRAAWQAEVDRLRRKAADARRAWLNAVTALVPAPAFSLGDDLSVSPAEFTDFVRRAAEDARPESREWADYASAFGSELYPTKYDTIQDTFFRNIRGAGHQRFLDTMVKLHEETTSNALTHSLFEHWDYSDEKLSLRWDPADDRRYALRFYKPSGSPTLTVRGANRLAIEALPLFPTFIVGSRLVTTGFTRHAEEMTITWPIWTAPLKLEPLLSVLSLAELQKNELSRRAVESRGVMQVYRAVRFQQDDFFNFSPARELL